MAPVGLADQQELRVDLADRAGRMPPELPERRRILGRRRHRRPAAPGRPEDVVEDEHRLGADDAVAAGRDLLERLGHRPGHLGMAVVELRRIRPRREMGVAPMGDPMAAVGAHLEVLVGIGGPLRGVGVDEPVRVTTDPEVLGGDMVRDEIQDQAEARLAEPLAKARQARRAAEAVGRFVGADGVRRPDDVVIRPVGQELGTAFAEPRRCPPQPATAGAGRPGGGQPDQVEAELGDRVDVARMHIAEGHSTAVARRESGHPGSRVDLDEPRVTSRRDPKRCPHSSRPPRRQRKPRASGARPG